MVTKAAEQGSAIAQSNLGTCYLNGTGAAKDEKEAVRELRTFGEAAAVVILRVDLDELIAEVTEFDPDGAVGGLDSFLFPAESAPFDRSMRRPKAVVSRRTREASFSASAGRARTVRRWPGRPFFMTSGETAASRAPSAINRSMA